MADPTEPKKETVRITLPPRPAGSPAPTGAAGRDTVRINMPARPPGNGMAPRPPAPGTAASPRPPMAKSPLPPAPSKAVATPPTFRKPPVPPAAATSVAPAASPPPRTAPIPAAAATGAAIGAMSTGPKKETARITVLPDPPARPAGVQMKKTQPLISTPEHIPPSAPVVVNVPQPIAVEEPSVIEELPMAFCWALLAVSTAILLIQIWNYVS